MICGNISNFFLFFSFYLFLVLFFFFLSFGFVYYFFFGPLRFLLLKEIEAIELILTLS